MRHLLFSSQEQESYDVAILIKQSSFHEKELREHYVQAMEAQGIDRNKIIAFTLQYDAKGKVTAGDTKKYLDNLLPALKQLGIKYIYCADAAYFKTLAKQAKADPHYGYVYNVGIKGYEFMQVTVGLNHGALVYNPNQYSKLDISIQALCDVYNGQYTDPGGDIIKFEDYPNTLQKIEWSLNRLHEFSVLTVDTETFSLKFLEAGLGTIAFAWNKHEGIAFPIECKQRFDNPEQNVRVANPEVNKLLKRFFESYKGKIIFHNAAYDIKVLIYALWMKHPQDYQGMLHGLDVLTRNLDDTKIITYLATNSTAGNVLGLKDLAQPFAGNWAQSDINDIKIIPLPELLRYNLVDCLSTFYVYEQYYPQMVADNQEKLYKELFLPTLKVIIQMEMVGMPLDKHEVLIAEREMLDDQQASLDILASSKLVQLAEKRLQLNEMVKANAKLKTKQHTIDKFADYKFNPNSGQHLAVLFHEVMQLPIIERTITKQPATGGDVIEKLLNHTQDPEEQQVLQALIDLSKVDKILSAFIPTFKEAYDKADGRSYLHGNFNLGGTVSGRLSSSKPNLQQLPAGSKYGKATKKCFKAPEGYLFCGADFNSLEDYISALTTKDPNKLSVYLNGYDGHCLRAFYYFSDKMKDLVEAHSKATTDEERVKIINSIKKVYPEWRQASKAPTFALTYQGTWTTLVKNCGFSKEVAQQIEAAYHEMYEVSDNWVRQKLKQACKDGYVEVAFGLRVRTPLLAKSVLGNSKTMREAEAEGRTAGNALGQSYGQLNNRAAVEFMQRVWESPYRYDIFPVALIHDAIYLMIRDDIEVLTWANKHLIECMRWQELPEIQHNEVKLGAALDVFYPSWANAITLPNDADAQTILKTCRDGYQEYLKELKKAA